MRNTPPLGYSKVMDCRLSPMQCTCRAPILAAFLSLSLVSGLPSAVSAADIRLTPKLEISEEYASNVDLDPDGAEVSALTTRITPGMDVRITSPRVTAALNSGVEVRHQTDGDDEGVDAEVDLTGTGNFEIVRDHFFLETGASISSQVRFAR